MRHEQTIPARRAAQLKCLAQVRGTIKVEADRQAVSDLYSRDPATLTDKDHELVQTLASRYLCEVMS